MKRVCFALALTLFAAPLFAQTLTLDKPSYLPTDQLVVTFTGAPGASHDYMAILPAPAVDPPTWPGSIIAWNYTSGTQQPATATLTSGIVRFAALPVGDYEVRFFPNDALVSTVRVPFSVKLPPITITGANPRIQWDQRTIVGTEPLAVVQGFLTRVLSDISANGALVSTVCTGTSQPYRCSAISPTFPSGKHWLSVLVEDADGNNAASSEQREFSVQLVCLNCPAAPANVTFTPGPQ